MDPFNKACQIPDRLITRVFLYKIQLAPTNGLINPNSNLPHICFTVIYLDQ